MAMLEDKEYEAKLQNLRRHAPFLKGMIDKLRAQERTQQVSKLESLWSMITSNKRLKFETLQKCEDVMLKIQSKSIAGVSKPCSQSDKSNIKSTKPDKNVTVIMNAVKLNIARAKLHNEVVTPTPKSPTPDRDLPQHIPITIPMDKVDIDEIASPDPDDDPTSWSETNENRYDSARPDVYKNAVMRKPEQKPPTPIIPSVNINTPPISMQDLQQLEDSIPVEKKLDTDSKKKELSVEEKLLKRPSKVSLVPAPIIKPKHKKGADNTKLKSDEKRKTDKEKDVSKSTSDPSKAKTSSITDAKPKSEKERRKSTESTSIHSSSTNKSSSSSKSSNSHKSSSHHSSDNKSTKTATSMKHSNHIHNNSKDKDGKHKDKKSQHFKSPRNEGCVEDQTSSDTIFGNLLTSIDDTLLIERDSAKDTKKKSSTKTCKQEKTSELDKSNKSPGSTEVIQEKPTEEKTVFKRLADKYNPRPKKKEPEVEKPVESIVASKPDGPLLPISTGPPSNLQHTIKFSPPPESHFIQQQKHHHQFNVQRRPNFNLYDVNLAMEHQRSPMEYDLSKIGPADFYSNKSPPLFNARQQQQQLPEPLMGRILLHPDPSFPTWNNNRGTEGNNDFQQGRRLQQQDPRLSRQHGVGDAPNTNNRFDNNFDRQVDGNRFNAFDRPGDANRFIRPDEANRFVRHDNNVVILDRLDDGNRFCRPNNDTFVRTEDANFDCNRFVRPDDNNAFDNARFVNRSEDNIFDGNRFNLRDGNRPFRPNDNSVDRQGQASRFFRPNDIILDRQIDGNRFVRPAAVDTRDTNRPFRALDKPDSRFLRPDDMIVPRPHDDDDITVKDNPFSRKDDFKRVPPKIEDTIRPDPRLQQRPPKSEPPKSIKVEPPSTSTSTQPKKEVYDEVYSRINIKVKDERESFTSPLDSIYEKKQQVTGKGYGVQNFRIPKKARPPPPVVKCPTPPPTAPRRRSPSPPLKRPPTPPRKRRSPSPPGERVPTPPSPPRIVDSDNKTEHMPNVPEIVAQLPESLRKDDRFGDVVNVLSSLLRDETALTKIKRLLTKGAKHTSCSDNDDDDDDDDDDNSEKDTKSVSKKLKSKKLVKRQPKKTAKKSAATMKSPSFVSVDSTSTDTESMQVRRSGRLRKRIMVFDDYDSEDTENTNKETEPPATQTSIMIKEQQFSGEQPLTDEQLDDIVSCIDPFDDFLPDNEADQLVEEALKQPAEKLEEEINKQLVNNIFDSLKNDDNLDVAVEDTQKIIDSWGLSDGNADKMIDSWNIPEEAESGTERLTTEDMFDKDEKDEDNSQDRQEDVRNEIDELIKNMPLNDSDKILDCDIVKEDKEKESIAKESDEDEITKCDDAISSITKKLTEENNKSISSRDDQCSEAKPVEKDAAIDKLKVFDDVALSNNKARPLRSSPRVRPPVSYTDDVKPRGKRSSKKPDTTENCSSDSPTKLVSQTTPEKVSGDEVKDDEITVVDNECSAGETEPEEKIDGEQSKIDENTEHNNQKEIVVTKRAPSIAMIHLDIVITELIAKYSAVADVTSSSNNAGERVAKKSHKKAGSKPKRKVLPIQEDIKVKVEAVEIEGGAAADSIAKATCKYEDKSEEVGSETVERPNSRNAKKQNIDVFEPSESIAEDNSEGVVEETAETINKKADSLIKDTSKVEDTASTPSTEHAVEKNNTNVGSGTTADTFSETSEGLPKDSSLIDDAADSEVGKVQSSNKEISTENISIEDTNTATESTTKVVGSKTLIELCSTDAVEAVSGEVSTTPNESPEKKTAVSKKKRVIVKRRGRPLKSHAIKKKPAPKPLVESSTTSEGGSAIDLASVAEEPLVPKAGRTRKFRSELDKLHEDIKETMGDKVLTSKRTSMKSPRAADEIEETTKVIMEDSEESDESSKQIPTPTIRQKTKGGKVGVEQLRINKAPAKSKKGKAKQTKKAAPKEPSADEQSESDDNDSSTVLPLESSNQTKKRKKRHNAWRSGVIRSKKRKTGKMADAISDKTTDEQGDDESDLSDDIDTDYDVEFVEPDAEHYMLKGKPTKCRLCEFEGLSLVDHYVNNHRAGEVPVSRMCPEDSKLALEDSKDNKYYLDVVPQDLLMPGNRNKKIRFAFTCRFCLQEFPQFSNVQFADHIATHTGEYRHKCSGCELKNASARFIKIHYTEMHETKDDLNETAPVEIIIQPPLNFHTVFGYMCSECHFVQLSYRSVTEHIQIYHLDESAAAIKVNMSLPPGTAKKSKPPPAAPAPTVEVSLDTGVFTTQEVIMEEELQREEEANRTELMKEIHKEVTASRLSSVAELLKTRFDSSVELQPQELLPEQSPIVPKEVVRLPKAKPKDPPVDVKPCLEQLNQQLVLPKPLQSKLTKYTIFIIGPLKAVVSHANRTVDFACITDDCVYYTTDRKGMAHHCRTVHDNRCERIRCGYCVFMGNAVPLVEVFDHICAKHVDPLVVKEEPEDVGLSEKRVVVAKVAERKVPVPKSSKVKEVHSSPSPPCLPFMGNHFGIKIVHVAGGVTDDIIPLEEDNTTPQLVANTDEQQRKEEEEEEEIEIDEAASAPIPDAPLADVNAKEDSIGELPPLLPISQQSPSVLKKLSSLQRQLIKQSDLTVSKSGDGIIVSKVETKSHTLSNNSPLLMDEAMELTPNTNTSSVAFDGHSTAVTTVLLIDDVELSTSSPDKLEDISDAHQMLKTLAKVSILPKDSATAMKRRFHTGKTDLLYRCPDSKCGFASETRIDFLLHLRSAAGKHTDLQKVYRCVYCYTTLPLMHYSSHLFYYHGTSEFGCSRCCYRAVTPYHINLHKNNCHLYDQTDVMLLPLASDVPTATVEQAMNEYWSTKLKSLLNPYSCYCGGRFIVTAHYSGHLEKSHRGDLTRKGIDCRDCPMKGVKNMIAHYAQVHNNHLYHCIYCTFGGDTSAADVFSHQSARHPGLRMEVIVRTIATEALSLNSCKKSPVEDDSVWGKLVRLTNPQATKDSDTIKLLREAQATANSVSTVQTTTTTTISPPILSAETQTLPHQQTTSIVTVTSPQDDITIISSNCSTNTNNTPAENSIEIIDLIALSPDPEPIELQPSEDTAIALIVDEALPATFKSKPNSSRAPTPIAPIQSKTQSLRGQYSPSRCVTPTNQPIVSPSVGSNITTPDEDIFVVVQAASEVPLAGSDLFVCAQCGIHCTTSGVFRAHIHDCVKVDREANTKPYACAHCERRSKTSTALLDHMRVHGFPRYRCGLCDFKHTQPWNIRTHMRTEHNISTCVQVAAHPNKLDDDFDDFIYRPRQSQLAPSAHQSTPTSTLTTHGQTQANKEQTTRAGGGAGGKDRKLSTSSSTDGDSSIGADGFAVPMQKFLPTEVDKLPMRAVYTTEVGCGLCGYKSKVRTNIIRHLKLHVDGLAPTDLPTSACVNPVPCLERDELMFDKMTNLAYNSHQADLVSSRTTTVGGTGRMGGNMKAELVTAEKKPAAADEGAGGGIGPQYVPCSKRYVCGAVDCNYLCHDEIVFRRHIQALHSHSEVSYRCRHCPPAKTPTPPAMMNVELVLRHLRLHGATLYKCAHCPFLHNMRSIIDRHITERHLERNVPNQLKAIIIVRDLVEEKDEDSSTLSSNSNSSAAASSNNAVVSGSGGEKSAAPAAYSKPTGMSSKDAKPWRCAMCKVRCVTIEDIVNHTTNKHKIGSRYKCGYCDYSNDDRDSYIPHFAKHHPDSPHPDIITIYFHDPAATTVAAAAAAAAAATSIDQQDPAAAQQQQQLLQQSSSNESDHDFDTTPLWRKPTTGDVRHIRGILLETRGQHMQHRRAEQQAIGKEDGKGGGGGKRDRWSTAATAGETEMTAKNCESDSLSSPPPKKQAKLSAANRVAGKRAAKSETSQQEVFPCSSLVISVPVDEDIRYYCDERSNLRLVDVNNLSVKKLLIAGNLHGRYGEYGRPTESGYRCPKCVIFETNGERQLLNHLYKEIDYKRYECERCQTRSSLSQSIYMRCPAVPPSSQPPHSDCIIYSRVDVAKEQWALMVLAIQTRIAAHLTANKLWPQARTLGGDMGEQGMDASAVMKGLQLAYAIKGSFRPTDIFPKCTHSRITVTHKPPPKNIQDQYQLPKKTIVSSRYPLRNTNTAMTQSTVATAAKEGTVQCKTKVNQMSGKLTNIFAQVQNSKVTAPNLVKLVPKKHKQQQRRGDGDIKGGIKMFPNVLPEVVTIEEGRLEHDWDGQGRETAASNDDDEEDDDNDDDEVEIIDPLVDIVDVDAEPDDCQEVIDTAVTAAATSAAKKVESVTVSSFLPTIGDTDPLAPMDPLMDDATYSDNDSMGGLEIAEDDIDEEIEPQLSPNRNMKALSIQTILSPAKTTQQSHAELSITAIKTATVDTTTYSDEQVVSSTTSEQQVSVQVEQGDKPGIIATLTPIDASLVGRLRVIGDASMVGCFGLSSGLSVQLTGTPLQQRQQVLAEKGAATAGVKTTHKCPHCNYSSMNVQSVKKHEVRHWAEKPHHCGFVYPTGVQCDFQHHYRPNVAKHIADSHPRIPGQQIPIIHVKITNPTIISLRRARSSTALADSGDLGTASTALSPTAAADGDDDDNSTNKRMRFGNVDGGGGDGVTEEDFVERYTCPTCTYTSHKMRYVQQHLRLHVKCIKCQLCNEKDTLKKRLTEEKCSLFHENVPSRLVIEYDSYELDRLKNLIQKIRVPKSSLQTLDQTQTADDDDDNEFLEVFKTVRNYPTKQQRFAAKQQQQFNLNSMIAAQQQQQLIPLSQCLTTFDVATSTYIPMQQQSGIDDIVNTVYRVDSATVTTASSLNDGQDKEGGMRLLSQPPILLNSFLGQPRISSCSSQQQQPTARKSTGGCSILRPNLTLSPLYAPANFYTSSPQNTEQESFHTDTIH